MKTTYDVIFNDSDNSDNKGFKESLQYCKEYISRYNGTKESYFADYEGGIVSIVCNETGETVFETEIKASKKYNYAYYHTPISKNDFLRNVPENWEEEVVNGAYSWGGYNANEID